MLLSQTVYLKIISIEIKEKHVEHPVERFFLFVFACHIIYKTFLYMFLMKLTLEINHNKIFNIDMLNVIHLH